jgi:hypothetical protein
MDRGNNRECKDTGIGIRKEWSHEQGWRYEEGQEYNRDLYKCRGRVKIEIHTKIGI